MTRVLFYSPYASWSYHTALEATWGHALRSRGTEVQFVLCNGLSKSCDVYRENLNPRDERACLDCQATTATLFSQLGMPYDWLGTYLPLGTRERAEAWAAELADDELLDARWRDMEVGRWAATSAYNQFRSAVLDITDPTVVRIVRELLAGTVVQLEALDVLLDTHRPDTLVLLNGRFSGHWTAIELAQRKGIRFVSHERGFQADTVRFAENSRTHELGVMHELWEQWRDIPLSPAEATHAATVLEDRRLGRNFSRLSFSPPVQKRADVIEELGLDERPLVAVFTSSDDETAAFPERRRGAFPRSSDFVPAVIELALARPGVKFVVRIHPNIQKSQVGTNEEALCHAKELRDTAPPNMHVVMPLDDVSTYTLLDLADVGLVYASTVGLEMAACGKPVLCMAQATYSHTGIAQQIDTPDELGPALDRALAQGIDFEVARRAMRWVYRYFHEYSIPFDLVRGDPNDGPATLNYESVEDLVEGRHEQLDRICSFLQGHTPSPVAGVTAKDRARTPDAETAALELWLRLVNGEHERRAAV